MSETASTARNVLVAAYACNPVQGSEEAVGWNWVRSIAAIADKVTVITAAFHRADIEAAGDPGPDLRFVYVPHRSYHYAPTPLWKRIEV